MLIDLCELLQLIAQKICVLPVKTEFVEKGKQHEDQRAILK